MDMRSARWALCGVVLGLAPALAAQEPGDISSIVARFYPTSLDADLSAIRAGNTDVRRQCHAVLERDADRNPTVVLAAYTNSQSGVVRVLTRGPAGFEPADEAAGAPLTGSACSASVVDVDGDGRAEAVVRFSVGRDTRDWVYAWRDGALADLSPLTAAGAPIPVVNSSLVDLDGDGLLELRSRPSGADASAPALPVTVFRLSAGTYVATP
jgi:hypothetical protein